MRCTAKSLKRPFVWGIPTPVPIYVAAWGEIDKIRVE